MVEFPGNDEIFEQISKKLRENFFLTVIDSYIERLLDKKLELALSEDRPTAGFSLSFISDDEINDLKQKFPKRTTEVSEDELIKVLNMKRENFLLQNIDLPYKEEKAVIKSFVQTHLEPYINGEITEENENVNRKPMLEKLMKQLDGMGSDIPKGIIRKLAFDSYIEVVAEGVDLLARGAVFVVDALAEALLIALPKDFPRIEEMGITEGVLADLLREIADKRLLALLARGEKG